MKRKYGNWIYENLKAETHTYLAKIELKTNKKLNKIREKAEKKEFGKNYWFFSNRVVASELISAGQTDSPNSLKKKAKNVANPLMRMLILSMIWKSWTIFAVKNVNRDDIPSEEEDVDEKNSDTEFSGNLIQKKQE